MAKVAKDLNINYRTALRWWKYYEGTEEVEYKKSEQNSDPKSSLTTEHNEYKSRRRKRLKSSCHEGALDMLIEAQRSATEEGRHLLNPGTVAFHSTDSGEITADENAQVVDEANKGDSTENHETDVSLDLLYPFGAKKILGKLTGDDAQKIQSFEIKESSIVASMKKHVITLLLKNSKRQIP